MISRAVMYRLNSRSVLSDGVTVAATNTHDLGKANLEFRRSFLTSQTSLEKERPFTPREPKSKQNSTAKGKSSPKTVGDASGTQAATASPGNRVAADSSSGSIVKYSTNMSRLVSSLLCRPQSDQAIHIPDLTMANLDFRRSFLTSQTLLEKERPFTPKEPKSKQDSTAKGKSSPKTVGDASGTQAPTASPGNRVAADSSSGSTLKYSANMSRLASSLLCRPQSDQAIHIQDLGKANLEFRRSFLTSQTLLEKERPFTAREPKSQQDSTSKSSPKAIGDASGTQAPTASDANRAAADSTSR